MTDFVTPSGRTRTTPRPWLPLVTPSGCSYRGRNDESPPRFPCFNKGTVTVRQLTGNPFVTRTVCERHATVMVESGHFQIEQETTS